ncbi:MAG TPA: DUF3152 domain-containing protein [Pilimelia sp.]|nr:DUF3152 domain-containing protein [Pilimelia sp.]
MPARQPTSSYGDPRVRRPVPGGPGVLRIRQGAVAAPVTHRRPARGRRKVVAALLAFAVVPVGFALVRGGVLDWAWPAEARAPAWWTAASDPSASDAPAGDPSATTGPPAVSVAPGLVTPKGAPPEPLSLPGGFPAAGPGTFAVHPTPGPVLGRSGTLRRFQVAVEHGVPEELGALAAMVDATLRDPRGWTAGQQMRFQRAGRGSPHDFTFYLVTGATAQRMCAEGGVDIRVGGQPYTSCRAIGKVIINLARWRLSVPPYVDRKVPLAVYRQYLINHEVGHELGHGHERCPGSGQPAPVMLKQTLGLEGCTTNAWPYVDGRRYTGPPV